MSVTVSPWVVWAVLSLALFGVVFLWRVARDAARDLRAWWRRDRVTPLLEDEAGVLCDGCAGQMHCDGADDLCNCTCAWPEDWDGDPLEGLPPERTREELGFTDPRMGPAERAFWSDLDQLGPHGMLRAERERRASWWEAEHRAAYESLGFDYPSGLMARVRELTPASEITQADVSRWISKLGPA